MELQGTYTGMLYTFKCKWELSASNHHQFALNCIVNTVILDSLHSTMIAEQQFILFYDS